MASPPSTFMIGSSFLRNSTTFCQCRFFLYSVRHPRGLRLHTVGRSWEFQSGRTNSVSHERTNEPTMRVFSIPTTLLCRACVTRKASARNLDAPRRRSASVKTTQERGKRQQKMNHAKNDVQMMNERVPRTTNPCAVL